MFGGSFDVERTIMGWSRKGAAIENLKAKLQEFVTAPVIVVEDAAEGELNGGYSPVGVVNGCEKYKKNNGRWECCPNDNAADEAMASSTAASVIVFANGRWELRLNDDDADEGDDDEKAAKAKKEAPAPASDWKVYYDTSGRPYYHNAKTGVTQWTPPTA